MFCVAFPVRVFSYLFMNPRIIIIILSVLLLYCSHLCFNVLFALFEPVMMLSANEQVQAPLPFGEVLLLTVTRRYSYLNICEQCNPECMRCIKSHCYTIKIFFLIVQAFHKAILYHCGLGYGRSVCIMLLTSSKPFAYYVSLSTGELTHIYTFINSSSVCEKCCLSVKQL